MANSCSAQKKVTTFLESYDIKPIRNEYLIAPSFVSKAKDYAKDLQNYAYNKYKLGPESPLLTVGKATGFKNIGYNKVIINSKNFTKLQKLMGDKVESEALDRDSMRNYNKIQKQVEDDKKILDKFLEEQAEIEGYAQAYQDMLDTYNREVEEYNKFLEENPTDDEDDFSYSQRVNYNLKSVNILSSNKATEVFTKGEKNNWDISKILTELQVPKEQKQLILETGLTNKDEIAVELASKYSQVVEINTAKEKAKDYDMIDTTGEGDFEPVEFIPDTDLEEQYDEEGNIIGMKEVLSEKGKQQIKEKENERKPTDYYVDLTVPGGTNYTENEIATPSITPSIRGHAEFSTGNGIGWFRSDDKHAFTGFLEDLIASGTIKKVPCG